MKILIVITKSELGGAQVFALNLARGLKDAGEDVTVAGGPGDYLPKELNKFGINFKRLFNLARSYNPLQSLNFISELKQYVISEGFDVVHLNSTNALLGAWGLSTLKPQPRLVFTVHGLSLLDNKHQALTPLKYAYRLFFRTAFKKLHDIVFVSQLNFDYAKSSGLLDGLKAKSHLIYNGITQKNDYWLSREEARRELKLNEDDYIYGSIGRLAYPKNYEFLINSHKALQAIKPNARLVLIGDGPERAKYEDLITLYQLGRDVILRGEIPEASRYLKAFDLFVLPSIFEGLSLSLIEAISAGIPVIASRVGGSEEIVGVSNCFKLNDQADFLRLVKNAKPVATINQPFTLQQMVDGYLRVYKR
ncbi:MAG: glycosyltransferase [Patescibacteria group bacterium]